MSEQENKPPSQRLPEPINEAETPTGEYAPEALKRQSLTQALRRSRSLAELRALLRQRMREIWPGHEVFFAIYENARNRFLVLAPNGALLPKSGESFGLSQFLTVPDRRHAYTEQIQSDPDLLGDLGAQATAEGLMIRSLAVPIRREGFLRAAVGIFAPRTFEWSDSDAVELAELGRLFLETYDLSRRLEAMPYKLKTPPPMAPTELAADWQRLRELVDFHDTLLRIHFAMLQPSEVLFAACRDMAPFFAGFHVSLSVYYPESRLFVTHSPTGEPTRVPGDEAVDGYFLHYRDEDVLAIEDYGLWTPSAPLSPVVRIRHRQFAAGLFAAGRMHGSLVAVAGLQSLKPVQWDGREIELVRDAARGLALVYYTAMLCDNLTYSCREAHRQLEEARAQVRHWQRRTEHVEKAAEIARSLGQFRTVEEQIAELNRRLGEMWADCRVSVRRYMREQNAFESHRAAEPPQSARPARYCIESLFLNTVPVSHIVCDSPQEISYYQELDPELVAECSLEGLRSFCAIPIFVGHYLWGTVTLKRREPGGCTPYVELLTEIGKAVAIPIGIVEPPK
jgi:hypothetical protein